MHTAHAADQSRAPSKPIPVVFAGHGSPMNIIEDNPWSRGFRELAQALPRPTAILAVSAHWYLPGIYLTGDIKPRTIHDFGGFPKALYEIHYSAPGKLDLAHKVRALIGEERSALSTDWGFDHGTWSVLRWLYPAADVPVVQLSIDRRLSPAQHLDLARSLGELREQGVLILGSGNVVHNLRDAIGRMHSGNADTPPWAVRFDSTVKQVLEQRDTTKLVDLWQTEDGRVSHPSLDHWLPLLYAYGLTGEGDALRFTSEGFDLGSVSMRNAVWG